MITSSWTTWKDKYTTVLYSPLNDINCNRRELQPLPDILRWLKCHELHHMICALIGIMVGQV